MSLMLDFYGLLEHPFGVSPNPRFIYSSVQHRGALEELVLGIEEHDGLAALIGEAGSGKTTLLLEVVQRYRERADIALVFNTQCSGEALLRLIATELHIPGAEQEQDAMRLNRLIAGFVSAAERTKPVIIIIDEAQNLGSEALETVRLLSNVEATGHKFLHIILAGQPGLETNLRTASHGQLLQRITTMSRMVPLSGSQVRDYIACRLRAAGYAGPPLFTDDALGKIAKESQGIPREINRICNNAVRLGFGLRQREITGGIVDAVLADFNPVPKTKKRAAKRALEGEQKTDGMKAGGSEASESIDPDAVAEESGASGSGAWAEEGVSSEGPNALAEMPGARLGAEHFSLGDDVIRSLLQEMDGKAGAPEGRLEAAGGEAGIEGLPEASPGSQGANSRDKAEDDPWVVDAAVDLRLGDAVIDSVLLGETLNEGRPAGESEKLAGKLEPAVGKEPMVEAKASGAARPFGLGDESFEEFLSKLDSDLVLGGKSQQKAAEVRTQGGPVEHQNSGAAGVGPAEAVPVEAVPVDPRVSQIFASRSSKAPVRPQAAGAPAETRQAEVHADPRVSQIFAPRKAKGGSPKQAFAKAATAPATRPASLPVSLNEEPVEKGSSVDDDLRGSFLPLQLPVQVPADVAIQRRVVELAGVTKAKGESKMRHLHAAIVIPVCAVVLTLIMLAALAFFGSRKPPAQAKPLMPVRPPVEQAAESETADSKDSGKSGKARDSRAVLVKMVRPLYPADAMESHLYGNVSLDVSIGADGLVHHTRVLSGNPVLAKAAVKAVQRWRYTPARQNGVPVQAEEKIVVSFDEKQ